MADFAPPHPGEVLRKDFLKPLNMSEHAAAKVLGIPQVRLSEIVSGRRSVSPNTALRLARYFGTSTEFWIGMQAAYDLELARNAAASRIAAKETPRAA
ncbi:HigA family addiction module antitoxin [Blastochloris sulfoviridis]|uniref:HigA family addiction module antidote protein n=1 Tax=Blastochloris sulfoviridis TaxID=50712 RepID=A0A5M6I3A9_9HYPH|nr:HigA family addiction module antitoxin [Blastochloris sulfoviridis]KAA5602691.1 HigA family addiction module antidote protein [Blastochloris sulfoviridis]